MEDSDSPPENPAGSRLARNIRQGTLAASCLLAADAIFAVIVYRHLGPRVLVGSIAIGIWMGAFLGLALGLAGALLARLLDTDDEAWEPRLARWLLPVDRAERFDREGTLLSLAILAPLFTVCVALSSHRIALQVVRPHFVALGVALASLGWAITLGLAFMPLRRRLGRMAEASSSSAALGVIFASAARVLLGLALVTIAAGAMLLAGYWSVFRYLPWALLLRLLGALITFLALRALGRKLSRRTSRRVGAVAVLLTLASVAITFDIPAHARSTRRIGYQEFVVGRAAMSLLRPALDFDRDGHVPVLMEGDCEPFDATIHPGATEIPENGVDEDCDGIDLEAANHLASGRYDLPVPDSLPSRPSILLITVDAFSPRHMRAFGYAHEVTPFIDRLAAESVFFASAFAGGPSTRLSFPSFFTSRWDSEIPRRRSPRKPHPITCRECQIAEILKSAGYSTEAVIPDPYFAPRSWESIGNGFDGIHRGAISDNPNNAPAVTREAIGVMEASASDEPLFMWVHYYDAHSPHDAIPGEPARSQALIDLYDAELSQVDRSIAPLVEAMRARDPESLVILTSDHSLVLDHPRPGTRRASYGYDLLSATLHVPLIFSAPYLRPGRHEQTVTLLDVLPTLANILRLPRGRLFRGTSLLPELLGEERSEERLHFHEFWLSEALFAGRDPLKMVSVRDDRLNLILNRTTGVEQLFDYRRDYYELSNLLDQAEAPDETASLRAALQHFVVTQTAHPSGTVAP